MIIRGEKGRRDVVYIDYENGTIFRAKGEMLSNGNFWIYNKKSIIQVNPIQRKIISTKEYEKLKNDVHIYNKGIKNKIEFD